MAQALPFIGYAVGSFFTGGFLGVSFAAWGWIGGSLLASAMGGQHHRGPRLDDLNIVGTDYGGCIPWAAGSPRLAPQYAWASPMREIANTEKVGKGPSNKQTTYTYECDVGVVLTENVTEGVARDWVNSELIRNGLTTKDGVWEAVTVYTGAADQLPDPTYEAIYGPGNVSAFRGCTTIVIRGLQLGYGKQLPNLEHQVVKVGEPIDDDDYLDYSGKNVPVSIDGEAAGWGGTTTDEAVFGAAGVFLGGTNVVPGSALVFYEDTGLTRDMPEEWSIRCWLYDEGDGTFGNYVLAFGNDDGNPAGLWVYRTASDAGEVLRASYRGNPFTIDSPSSPPKNDWYYFELTKLAGTVYMFIDGVLVGTASHEFDMPCFPSYWCIGSRYGFSPCWDGYIDDFVYTDGAGGHTTNYTPPTSPHEPNDSTLLYIPFNRPGGLIPGSEPLDSVLEQLLQRCGMVSSQFDVASALGTVLVHGYASSQVTSTRAHCEMLRPFGLYEANCSDKLYIRPRASTPVGTVEWSDLGAVEGAGDASDPFPLRLGNETEMPAQIAVRYRNVAADWNVGTEFSDRLNSSQTSTQVVEMAFGMTPTQAKALADTMLKDVMAGLGRATLRVGGRKYAKFEPGDVLETKSPQGRTYRFRILVKKDTIVMQEWDVVLDDASVLDTPGITYEGYVSTENPVRVAPTEWEAMAIRPLRDADASEPGPYVAVTPAKTAESDEWPGAVFVRARLPEAFEQVFTSGDVCTMGTCLTTLGDYSGGSGVVQRGNKLRVRVNRELSSAAYYDFFTVRTTNAAVVGNEPVRFIRADFIGMDGLFYIYDLSGFLRGQLGMESEIPLHGSGERFVLLDNSLRRMVNETADIDQAQQVKAVTLNLLLDSVTDEEFTDDGIALRPLSPVYLRASPDSGDIDLQWIRRSRLVSRWTDAGVIAPLGELAESYRVKVFDDPDADPVRTVFVTSPEWTYSAADIASDGFTTGDPITFTVHQLSDMVGEGDAATLEAEAP
jgi:hypothetical protein